MWNKLLGRDFLKNTGNPLMPFGDGSGGAMPIRGVSLKKLEFSRTMVG